MARVVSLKNSYNMNKWGGKRWDAENCEWVVEAAAAEENRGGDLEEIDVVVEDEEKEKDKSEGDGFTTVDFNLPILKGFRYYYPELVNDAAEDRDFLKFLMFFADDNTGSAEDAAAAENEPCVVQQQKRVRRASVVAMTTTAGK